MRLRVWAWHKVVVAFLLSNKWKRGRPTKELLPAINTLFPCTSTWYSSRIRRTPAGVQGIKDGATYYIMLLLFEIFKQSTSLFGSIVSISSFVNYLSSGCNGSCSIIPETSSLWFSYLISLEIPIERGCMLSKAPKECIRNLVLSED